MGFFDWLNRKPVEEKGIAISRASADALALFGAAPTASGQVVTAKTAVRCTPVLAAVRFISESIGSLPAIVYKRGDDGARDRDSEHPAHSLLHGRANPWTGSSEFLQSWVLDALLYGNGYALVIRVGNKPKEIHRLPPDATTVDMTSGEPVYRVGSGDKMAVYRWQDVLHLRAPVTFDGVTGESPVTLARQAIGLAMALEEHGASLFGNAARPSGVISHPGSLGDEAYASLKSSWDSAHTGKKAGGTAILEEGATWQALTFNSVDAQFNESRTFAVNEISRAFGVSPHILFELGRATYANVETLGTEVVTFGLLPWLKRAEAAIERALLDDDEHYVEFLLDGFLRADFTKRAEGYSKLITSRVLNPNEARAREGLPPYEGGNEFINPNVTGTAKPAGDPPPPSTES